MNRYAVIGFGCAGYHAVKAMREEGYQGEIHIFHDRQAPPANPMLTTYYVAGKLSREGMFPFGSLEEIAQKYDLHLHIDEKVVSIDYVGQTLSLENGGRFPYDQVLLATGASALVPPFPGSDSPAVHCMRTVEDADRLTQVLNQGGIRQAVVVGASMVGIKVAELLLKRGVSCTMADLAPRIFPMAALPEISQEIEDRVTGAGIELKMGHSIASIQEENGRYRVEYQNGVSQICDLVALCIGTRANTRLAGETLRVNRGIVVNDFMETNRPGVYAAGDCCEGINLQSGETQIIGLWANAALQGRTAGKNMAGQMEQYQGNIPHNITHFLDMDFIAFGDNRLAGESVSWQSADGKTTLRMVVDKGNLLCVNILDNYRISGILKAYFLKRLSGIREPLGATEQARLGRLGMPPSLVRQLSELEFMNWGRDTHGLHS